MSEYQLYEFVALDQRLTAKHMAELRKVSTRAEITPTSFRNEYHYGDFRGNPATLMARYFDAHRYFAAWGHPRLMLRLPKVAVDLVALRPYFTGRRKPCLTTTTEHVVLDFDTGDDERAFGCDEDVSLKTLARLRTELIKGDLRCAYLGWLLGLENGELPDSAREPQVPPGLAKRTAAQNAMIRFLGISPSVLDAVLRTPTKNGKRRTVGQLLAAADELGDA